MHLWPVTLLILLPQLLTSSSALLVDAQSYSSSWSSLLYASESGRYKISLNSPDVDWFLSQSDGAIKVPGTVPGDVYSDLYKAGIIPDPIAEFNDVKTRWIVNSNWTYRAEFYVNASLLSWTSSSSIDLVLEGVDTVAQVSINGLPSLRCDNHWRVYRVDVKSQLRPGWNSISVSIESPVGYAKEAASSYASRHGYEVPPACPPDTYNGECHFNFIRKPAYSFSWDWGPAVPTSGIWRPAYLDVYYGLAIDYVKFSAQPRPDAADVWRATVTGGIKFGNVGSGDGTAVRQACLIACIDSAGVGPLKRCFDLPDSSLRGQPDVIDNFTAAVNFDAVVNPKLWWPNGYGQQPLYTLRVTLCADGPECQLTSTETRQVAFRTIRLMQAPVGTQVSDGLTFEFVINRRPIFVKGANFVPTGMAISAADAAGVYSWLMTSAAQAGVNMLRVWGGGTIERPEFYDLADRLGILVWQDFPFACALYPTDPAFLGSVWREVRDSVRRLQHRASVAAWVANNENEGALANNWWPYGSNRSRFYSDYRLLYMATVRPAALAEDATRPVLLSSPTNAEASEWEGGIARDPQSTRAGDVHFYSYNSDMWLTETTPLTRFMSEFGFQSHPSLLTALSATADPRNIGVNTSFTLHREHQLNGIDYIARHNARHFQLQIPSWLAGINDATVQALLANYSVPPAELKQLTDQLATYAYLSYVSQVDQAEIYRRVTHVHAIHRCRLTDGMEGLSSGSMYWQLNDVWSAPTWSSIEHTGAWKVAHYYARRYYANRRVAMLKTLDGNVTAFYIDDANRGPLGGVAIRFTCYDVNNFTRGQGWTVRANLTSPNCPIELFSIKEADLISVCKCFEPSNCLVEAEILSDPSNGIQAADTFLEHYFFDLPKNFHRIRRPQLTVNVTNAGLAGVFTIELSSVTPLYSVHLQFACQGLAQSILSDNGFHMTVAVTALELKVPPSWISTDPEQIAACLLVHYL